MVITLKTEEIIRRIKAISHLEVADIVDVEARYRAEAGTEKIAVINNCMDDARKRLASVCRRFLRASRTTNVDNTTVIPTSYVYELTLSERRALNSADILEEAMNTFLVEYALSKFYSIVSQGELSNKHSLLAVDAGDNVQNILFTKMPPRV